MDFHELLAMLQNPGEDGTPETIYDDLTASYNGMAEGSAAKVSQLEQELSELAAKHTSVMAHNYELLTAVSDQGNTPDPAPSGDDDIENEDLATFDDLISYE